MEGEADELVVPGAAGLSGADAQPRLVHDGQAVGCDQREVLFLEAGSSAEAAGVSAACTEDFVARLNSKARCASGTASNASSLSSVSEGQRAVGAEEARDATAGQGDGNFIGPFERLRAELASIFVEEAQRLTVAIKKENARLLRRMEVLCESTPRSRDDNSFRRKVSRVSTSSDALFGGPADPLDPDECFGSAGSYAGSARSSMENAAPREPGSDTALAMRRSLESLDKQKRMKRSVSEERMLQPDSAEEASSSFVGRSSGSRSADAARLSLGQQGSPRVEASSAGDAVTPAVARLRRKQPHRRDGAQLAAALRKRQHTRLEPLDERPRVGDGALPNTPDHGQFDVVSPAGTAELQREIRRDDRLVTVPRKVNGIHGLDDLITNQLFELHGLVAAPGAERGSFGASAHFASEQPVGSFGLGSALGKQVKKIFARRPSLNQTPQSAEEGAGSSQDSLGQAWTSQSQMPPVQRKPSKMWFLSPSPSKELSSITRSVDMLPPLSSTRAHGEARQPSPPSEVDVKCSVAPEPQADAPQDEEATRGPDEDQRDTARSNADSVASQSSRNVSTLMLPSRSMGRGYSFLSVVSTVTETSSKSPTLVTLPSRANMHTLRTEQDDNIMRESQEALELKFDDIEVLTRATLVARRVSRLTVAICGIAPLRSGKFGKMYTWACLALQPCLLAVVAVEAGHKYDKALLFYCLTGLCSSLGSFFALVCLVRNDIRALLGPDQTPLESYAIANGYVGAMYTISIRRWGAVAAVWLVSGSSQVGIHFVCEAFHSWYICVVNVVAGAFLCSLFYSMLHIFAALELAIDRFCLRLFDHEDVSKGIGEWNLVQALLRRSSLTIESAFLSVCTGLLGVLVTTAVGLVAFVKAEVKVPSSRTLDTADAMCVGLWSGWVVPPFVLVFYLVFAAASLTERCSRVPALVNSGTFEGRVVDFEKQYLAQYIMHSAAGFYIKGVRLTAGWAIKLAYLFGVLLFTFLTQTVLTAPSPTS